MKQTLEDFLKGKTLPCTITCDEWVNIKWVEFYFCNLKNHYYGLDDNGVLYGSLPDNENTWRLYTPPKPKVKRAPYMVYNGGCSPCLTNVYYKDDKEFKADYGNLRFERMTEFEREFEE